MSVDIETTTENGTKVFVGGLAWETKDEDLMEAFSKFGKISSAEVILHRDTQRSKGFGFVTFELKEDAESAISEMTGQELQGREIRCDLALGKGSRREGRDSRRGRDGPYERRDRGNGRRDRGGRDYDRRDRGGRDYDRRDRGGRGFDRRDNGRSFERRERRDYDRGGRDYERDD